MSIASGPPAARSGRTQRRAISPCVSARAMAARWASAGRRPARLDGRLVEKGRIAVRDAALVRAGRVCLTDQLVHDRLHVRLGFGAQSEERPPRRAVRGDLGRRQPTTAAIAEEVVSGLHRRVDAGHVEAPGACDGPASGRERDSSLEEKGGGRQHLPTRGPFLSHGTVIWLHLGFRPSKAGEHDPAVPLRSVPAGSADRPGRPPAGRAGSGRSPSRSGRW